MALKIIGRNGGQLIAESTDEKPVCRYCSWLELMDIIVGKQRSLEFVCSRHLIGAPNRTRCDLFMRETGTDDE